MNALVRQYESETGEKVLYRRNGSDFHTLRYVQWLEKKAQAQATLMQEMAEKLRSPGIYQDNKVKELLARYKEMVGGR